MRVNLLAAISYLVAATIPSWAVELDVPIYIRAGDGQAADCATSKVTRLDPRGDNFLSVRSGPGGNYREIGRLHTGEIVTEYETRGHWIGIFYQTNDPICSSRTKN